VKLLTENYKMELFAFWQGRTFISLPRFEEKMSDETT
jgi:hypothetical protein